MIRRIDIALGLLLTAAANPGFTQAPETEQSFGSMAQPDVKAADCVAPRPPRELAKTAYIRNGYRAILRILAARHWQETGECTCVIQEITWDEVVNQGAKFIASDDPLRPFDTSDLRIRADALEAERAAACESP